MQRVPYQRVCTLQSATLFECVDKMPQARRSKSFPTSNNSSLTETRIAVAGSIYWLPPKNKLDIHLLQLYPVEDGLYDHPVVVLSTSTKKKEALVFVVGILTTPNIADAF